MINSELNVLKQMAKAIAQQFGKDCEVVIHDLSLENIDSSIVYIENGHVTGREVGGGPSGIVLDAMKRHDSMSLHDQYAYLIKTESGRLLKSTTIYIRDQQGEPRYIFAINYDITAMIAVENALKSFTDCPGNTESKRHQRISHDVNDLLDQLIQQSVDLVGVPVALMTKEDKVRAINYLNDAGAFLITKSGDKVSKYFGISKYTLYSYVNINK